MIANPNILKDMIDLHKRGHSIRVIADRLDIPKSTVHRYLRNPYLNTDLRIVKVTELQKKIIKMKEDGLTKKEILAKFNPKLKDVIRKEIEFTDYL